MSAIPYDEIDPPIRNLVRTINELPGIITSSSCSGHQEDHGDPPDRWHVGFQLDDDGPTDPWPLPDAWLSLEWLTWFVNGNLRRSTGIELMVNSAPPYLNRPGRTIYFMIEGVRGGTGMEPDEFAAKFKEYADETYLTAADAEAWAKREAEESHEARTHR